MEEILLVMGTERPTGGYRQPGPELCHVHAVWGGQWVDERTCNRIEVNLAKSRAKTIVRKATGNHLTHYHPKKHGRKFSEKPMVLDGETLRPKSTLPKT